MESEQDLRDGRRFDAAALADGAHLGGRSGLRAGSVAGRAGLRGGDRERHLGAVHGLVEAERDLRLEVASACLTRTPTAHAAAARPAGSAAAARSAAEQVRELSLIPT